VLQADERPRIQTLFTHHVYGLHHRKHEQVLIRHLCTTLQSTGRSSIGEITELRVSSGSATCAKLQQRGIPGRFLGFEGPFGGGIYRLLLGDGRVKQSQTVNVSDVRGTSLPSPPQVSATRGAAAGQGEVPVHDDDNEWHACRASPAMDRATGQPANGLAVMEPAAMEPKAVRTADGEQARVEPVVAELEAVGLTPGVPEEAELGAGEPEALEQEAAEPAAAGDPAAEEAAAEELAAGAGPLATQPAVGQGYWQTQRAGQRPAHSTRNPTPSYTSRANVAEVVSLDAALQNRAGMQIGEQLKKEIGSARGIKLGCSWRSRVNRRNCIANGGQGPAGCNDSGRRGGAHRERRSVQNPCLRLTLLVLLKLSSIREDVGGK
jgi:hypothetical protein